MDPMSDCDIRLVFTLPPRDSIHCSTKDAYTLEITFLAYLGYNILRLCNRLVSTPPLYKKNASCASDLFFIIVVFLFENNATIAMQSISYYVYG